MSAALRAASIKKEAGLLRIIGNYAINHPLKAGLGAVGTAGAATASKGKYRQYKAGFEPENQAMMQGPVPTSQGGVT
jgi:hypothetical protein